MEQAGAATILPDAELTPERLRADVDALVTDEPRRVAMAAAAAALARPDAARVIAREVLLAAGALEQAS
jgi:UDP-N-acetylglucosamine--N-acetylmuramyl-(pentapeptide) pyrophosphoryl-undecaprenol N-acetylglucosamine transferase